MDSEEIQGWIEYYKQSPWGELKNDYHAGLIASAIYNVNRSKSTDHLFEPSDFIPDRSNKTKTVEVEQQDWEFSYSIAKQYAGLFNK